MKFQPICKPYIYGKEAWNGERHAEVIQVDSCCGAWRCFKYINDIMVRDINSHDVSYQEATQRAKEFLK